MRVLLLSSSTGGGHDMRAGAFEAWAREPEMAAFNVTTERLQVLESTHGLYRFGVDLYNTIQRRAPWLHHAYFHYLEEAGMHVYPEGVLGAKSFMERIEALRPDVVLSTHAHLNHGFFALVRRVLGKRVRCVTYCGELYGGYGFSRHWVNPRADAFIGAVRETCAEAAWLGMPPTRNRVGGFLLKPAFYGDVFSPEARVAYVRKVLGLDPERFILVLATGANGAHNHLACLRALEETKLPVQVVALCGRNEAALARVRAWAEVYPGLPVRALPHTGEMHRLMEVASAIFARPGTGTTSEAMMRGCPIIFNGLGGVMPQEGITLKFARQHGFGSLVMRAAELPQAVTKLLDAGTLQRKRSALREACPALRPPDIFKQLTMLF